MDRPKWTTLIVQVDFRKMSFLRLLTVHVTPLCMARLLARENARLSDMRLLPRMVCR